MNADTQAAVAVMRQVRADLDATPDVYVSGVDQQLRALPEAYAACVRFMSSSECETLLAALAPSPGEVVGEGWKLVPVEPDEAMRQRVRERYEPHFTKDRQFVEGWVIAAVENYALMLDAAPTLPIAPPEPVRGKVVEALRKTGWTRLQADVAEDGAWQLHDMPDKPNPKGVWIADFVCEGLEQEEAEAIALVVNSTLASLPPKEPTRPNAADALAMLIPYARSAGLMAATPDPRLFEAIQLAEEVLAAATVKEEEGQ